MVGVEAAGEGLDTHRHAAPLARGDPGVLHGSFSYVMQDADGQTLPVHSCSAGLDYPGVGPEHALLQASGRAEYVAATDKEAMDAFEALTRLEGIMPALESSHAVAHAIELAAELSPESIVLINLSGRGDKDVGEVERLLAERKR